MTFIQLWSCHLSLEIKTLACILDKKVRYIQVYGISSKDFDSEMALQTLWHSSSRLHDSPHKKQLSCPTVAQIKDERFVDNDVVTIQRSLSWEKFVEHEGCLVSTRSKVQKYRTVSGQCHDLATETWTSQRNVDHCLFSVTKSTADSVRKLHGRRSFLLPEFLAMSSMVLSLCKMLRSECKFRSVLQSQSQNFVYDSEFWIQIGSYDLRLPYIV